MGLVLNIPTDYISSDFITNTPDKIAIIPKLSSPKLFLEFRKLLKCLPSRYAFHYLHYLSRRVFRWSFSKHVNMVIHYLHGIYLKSIFLGYMLEHSFQISRNLIVKYLLPILGYPDQVVFQIVDGVLRPPYSHTVFISPTQLVRQASLLRLPANRFPPLSKLGGIQRAFL